MTLLILGLVLFLGVHTLTTLRQTRGALIARLGEGPYKGLYALLSAAGLVLIVVGFGRYRGAGYIQVWNPPAFLHPVTLVLVWLAFVALATAYCPAGKIKATLRHPMLVGIKAWALGHLLVNGDLGSMVLFAALLAWAVYDRIALKRRGDQGAPASAFTAGDAIAVVVGSAAYAAMAWLHPTLIGVPVM
ncbi:MAG: NnrU family protein [Reyranellales bacterium]